MEKWAGWDALASAACLAHCSISCETSYVPTWYTSCFNTLPVYFAMDIAKMSKCQFLSTVVLLKINFGTFLKTLITVHTFLYHIFTCGDSLRHRSSNRLSAF